MCDKFLNGRSPLTLEELFVYLTHEFHLVHKTVNILDQDVIAGNQHLLLLALICRFIRYRLRIIRARIFCQLFCLILYAC